ncbi:MAG: hypothetical protein WCY30_03385 [Candidatus Neomarinimicrobiota bacterium]|jgi:hypothetical protein
MNLKVDGWNNFCRVFQLPDGYPRGYCFGGGISVNFIMVDWFYPVPSVSMSSISKEDWRKKVGEIVPEMIEYDTLYDSLCYNIRQKVYYRSEKKYLVICDFGASFIITGEPEDDKNQ